MMIYLRQPTITFANDAKNSLVHTEKETGNVSNHRNQRDQRLEHIFPTTHNPCLLCLRFLALARFPKINEYESYAFLI